MKLTFVVKLFKWNMPASYLVARRTVTGVLTVAMCTFASVSAANTLNDYTGSTTGNVTTGSNWSLTTVPTVSEDATFPVGAGTGIRNFGTGASSGSPGSWGSLNNLSPGTTISLRNDTSSASAVTLTLGGAGNLGNSVSGTSTDLIYVATGGTLNITGVNGSNTLALALGQSGSFNIAGTSTITSVISGVGFGITKTGVGTITLSAVNTFTGDTIVNTGILVANGPNAASSALGGSANILVNSGGTISAANDNSFVGSTTSGSKTITINTGGTISAGTTARSNHLHALVMNGGTLSVPGAATGVAATFGNWNFDFGVSTPLIGGTTSTMSGGSATLTQSGGTFFNIQGTHILNVSTVLAALGGGTALNKTGSGTLNLTASNAYAQGTIITGGTLLANTAVSGTNTATGTGAVSVGASGTLGGSGQIRPTGANGITVNGMLAPGDSIGTGTLTIDSGGSTAASILTMASGSLFKFELGAAGALLTTPGTSDRLAINNSAVGDVTFNNNAIDFLATGANGFYKLFDTSLANATLAGDTWAGLTYDTTTGVVSSGLVASNLIGVGTFIVGTASNGGNIGDIYLSVVPEPSSLVMMLFGGVMMWVLGRKRV